MGDPKSAQMFTRISPLFTSQSEKISASFTAMVIRFFLMAAYPVYWSHQSVPSTLSGICKVANPNVGLGFYAIQALVISLRMATTWIVCSYRSSQHRKQLDVGEPRNDQPNVKKKLFSCVINHCIFCSPVWTIGSTVCDSHNPKAGGKATPTCGDNAGPLPRTRVS